MQFENNYVENSIDVHILHPMHTESREFMLVVLGFLLRNLVNHRDTTNSNFCLSTCIFYFQNRLPPFHYYNGNCG